MRIFLKAIDYFELVSEATACSFHPAYVRLIRPMALLAAMTGALLLLAGCGDPRTEKTTDGRFLVQIMSEPDPIPLNEQFALRVQFKEMLPEILAADVKVAIDAVMPGHGHGMNTVPLVRETDSARDFRVEGMLFHMAGEWEITFTLTGPDSISLVTFKVRV